MLSAAISGTARLKERRLHWRPSRRGIEDVLAISRVLTQRGFRGFNLVAGPRIRRGDWTSLRKGGEFSLIPVLGI